MRSNFSARMTRRLLTTNFGARQQGPGVVAYIQPALVLSHSSSATPSLPPPRTKPPLPSPPVLLPRTHATPLVAPGFRIQAQPELVLRLRACIDVGTPSAWPYDQSTSGEEADPDPEAIATAASEAAPSPATAATAVAWSGSTASPAVMPLATAEAELELAPTPSLEVELALALSTATTLALELELALDELLEPDDAPVRGEAGPLSCLSRSSSALQWRCARVCMR